MKSLKIKCYRLSILISSKSGDAFDHETVARQRPGFVEAANLNWKQFNNFKQWILHNNPVLG